MVVISLPRHALIRLGESASPEWDECGRAKQLYPPEEVAVIYENAGHHFGKPELQRNVRRGRRYGRLCLRGDSLGQLTPSRRSFCGQNAHDILTYVELGRRIEFPRITNGPSPVPILGFSGDGPARPSRPYRLISDVGFCLRKARGDPGGCPLESVPLRSATAELNMGWLTSSRRTSGSSRASWRRTGSATEEKPRRR